MATISPGRSTKFAPRWRREKLASWSLYYDVEAHGRNASQSREKCVCGLRAIPQKSPPNAAWKNPRSSCTIIEAAKTKCSPRAWQRPTPFVDKTMYVSWNAMFVSAYLDAARVLGWSRRRIRARFALKTLDRMLREVWSESRGFGHRIGGPALDGSLDDQVFGVLALLDAYEATLESRYFDARNENTRSRHRALRRRRRRRIFRSTQRRRPHGWPRRPPQAIPGFADARRKFRRELSRCAGLLAFTGDARATTSPPENPGEPSRASRRSTDFSPPLTVSPPSFSPITHCKWSSPARPTIGSPNLWKLAAHRVFRFGKAVLRCTPGTALTSIWPAP